MPAEAILKRFYLGQPGTVTGVLFTVDAARRVTIKQVTLANTTALPATVTLGVNATTAAARVVPGVSIPANTIVVVDMTLVLEAAEAIHGLQGTASAITVQISGVEEQV